MTDPSPKGPSDHPPDAPTRPADVAEPPTGRLLIAITTLAVIVGLVLRFVPRSGLWLDEALSVNIANLPIGDIPDALRRDGHPPLFYVLLHLWNSIGPASDWWVRAMSGLFGVLTLPLMYLAGRRVAERDGGLGARRTGLIALAIFAVMPFGIRYGAEARMYSLVMLLAAAGYLLVDDLLRARHIGRERVVVTVAAALVAAALLWTHYWSMWLLAAVGLLALWRAWREPDPQRRVGARLLIGALVAGGVLFLPWISTLLYQSGHTGTPWGERYGPGSVIVFTIVDFAGAKYGIAHLLTYLLVPLILLAAMAYIQRVRRADSPSTAPAAATAPATALATSGVGPADEAQQIVITMRVLPRVRNELLVVAATMGIGWCATAASGNTFSSRYASGIYPLFLLCIAAGVAVLRRPVATSVVLAVVVLASAFGGVGVVRGDRSQNGQLAQAIVDDASQSASPAVVIACPDQLGVSLQRDLDQLEESAGGASLGDVIPYPTGGDPNFIDWVDYGERNSAASPTAFLEQVASRIPADATVYLVTSPSYRTFEGQCEGLTALLNQDRDATEAVPADDSGIDEYASLWVFSPRA